MPVTLSRFRAEDYRGRKKTGEFAASIGLPLARRAAGNA